MRSHGWSVPARRAFFVLASLPLYASAQVDLFNSTLPATTDDATTTTSVVVPPETVIDEPVGETTTESSIIVAETTASDWIPDAPETVEPVNTPGSETTTEELGQDTTTTDLLFDTTTTELPVDTTTAEPLVDTTTSTDLPADTTTTELAVDTTTTTDLPADTTTTELPVDTTTTELAVDTTTTTELPADTTTTTAELPVDTTTTEQQQPADTTTTAEQPADTTTEAPVTEDPQPTITDAPILTTATGAAATSSVSSVSTEILGLVPIINSWKDDPENLKDETKDKVDDVKDHVIAVIKSLGGDPDKGCDGKRKRGLLGAIGDVINSLVCIVQDLTDISGGIIVGDVTGVTGTITGAQSKTEDLTDEEKDEDEDEDNSTEEKSEQESTEQESSTEEPTSTTTSPCTEDTAEHVTIICKPTTVTEDGNVRSIETCFSSITAEVTGCSVTEATTIISTTGTAAAMTPCASDTCGGGDACPMGELPLSGADMAYASTQVDCDAISTITTSELPTGYGTLNDISVAEPTPHSDSDDSAAEKRDLSPRAFLDNTSPNPLYVATLSPIWVSQLGDASGHWFNYPETGQGFVGVNGIYGCTAVIIASEKGVYLSHIWENPVFIDNDWNPTSDDSFNTNAFEALRDGTAFAQSITGLIGDEANPGVLNAIYAPKVFILTPFTTPNDPKGITTRLRYQDRAQQLADNLARAIPGSGGQGYLLGYTRTNQQLSTMEPGFLGRAIFEVDVLQSVLVSAHAAEGSLGLRVGRWRLWVEDQLITYQDFWIPDRAPQGNQKRQDSDADACLIVGGGSGSTTEATSTATESTTGSETTESTEATSTEATSTETETTETETSQTETTQTEASSDSTTTDVETTETTAADSTTTETQTETSETTTGSTKPPTTLQTSTITTTSAPDTTSDEETSTTEDAFTGPVLCVNFGGPRVATPYCQCSTTTEGQTFFASAPLISNHCTDYTTFPSPVTLKPTITEPPPEPTPWVTTEDNGAILSYPDQTVVIGQVIGSVKYTRTVGEGTPVTIRPPEPTQTNANNKGSSQCHSIDDACDRAIAKFNDDVIYTEFASYYTRIKKGIIIAVTFGQAGCVVEYNCEDWGQGGMNGKQIKDAYQYLKDNNDVSRCGTNYLSNTCRVTANYCTNCNEKHQKID